jgi:hypothetical protein
MKIKYILWGLAAIVLALLLIILLPIDDKLDAEAAAWVERANDIEDVPGNGYYYLIGIMASVDEDPMIVGKALIDDYRQVELKFLNGELEEFTLQEYPAEKKLPSPAGDYYCRLQEAGCFTRRAANVPALRAELKTHAVLLQRYQRYMQFAALKPLTEPSMHEPIAPYNYVARGHKLQQFRIIVEYISGNRNQAFDLLNQNIGEVRRQLAQAPNLIGKMVMLNMLSEDVDLLVQFTPIGSRIRPMPALTPEERSLTAAMTREFGGPANLLRQLEADPYLLSESRGFFEKSLERLALASLKPNMTLNSLFPHYRTVGELSETGAAEFNQRHGASLLEIKVEFNLRNPVGSILNSISIPQFAPYVARVHDVDCKIALLNAALALDPSEWNKILQDEAELQASNPYNPEERPYVDPETRAVCFKGPLEDPQQRRCIRKDKAI